MYRLLDVLAGRTETKGISGYVLIDGQDQPHNFKCMTGYVVQVKLSDDARFRLHYLSVLEVCSRRGAIQIHVYLYLYLYTTHQAIAYTVLL